LLFIDLIPCFFQLTASKVVAMDIIISVAAKIYEYTVVLVVNLVTYYTTKETLKG